MESYFDQRISKPFVVRASNDDLQYILMGCYTFVSTEALLLWVDGVAPMSKTIEKLADIATKLNDKEILFLQGLLIPQETVQKHMKMVEKRDRRPAVRGVFLSTGFLLVLGVVAIPSLMLGGMVSHLSWEWSTLFTRITGMGHLSLSSCLIIGGVFAGLIFSAIIGRMSYDVVWPRWVTTLAQTDIKTYSWHDIHHTERRFPPEATSAIDKVKILFPDTVFFVKSYGSDPILSARIKGIDHDIYMWDE